MASRPLLLSFDSCKRLNWWRSYNKRKSFNSRRSSASQRESIGDASTAAEDGANSDEWIDEGKIRIKTRHQMASRLRQLVLNEDADSDNAPSRSTDHLAEIKTKLITSEHSSVSACQLCAEVFIAESNTVSNETGDRSKPDGRGTLLRKLGEMTVVKANILTAKLKSNDREQHLAGNSLPAPKSAAVGTGPKPDSKIDCATCCLVICNKCARRVPLPTFHDACTSASKPVQVCRCCLPLVKAVQRDLLTELEPPLTVDEGRRFINTLWFQNTRFCQLRSLLERSERILTSLTPQISDTASTTGSTVTSASLSLPSTQLSSSLPVGSMSLQSSLPVGKRGRRREKRHLLRRSKAWYDLNDALEELGKMLPSGVDSAGRPLATPKSASGIVWKPHNQTECGLLNKFAEAVRDCYQQYHAEMVTAFSPEAMPGDDGDQNGNRQAFDVDNESGFGDNESVSRSSGKNQLYVNRTKLDHDACVAAYCLIRQLYLEYETLRSTPSLKPSSSGSQFQPNNAPRTSTSSIGNAGRLSADGNSSLRTMGSTGNNFKDELKLSKDRQKRQKAISSQLTGLEQTAGVELRQHLSAGSQGGADAAWDLGTAAANRLVQERSRDLPLLTTSEANPSLKTPTFKMLTGGTSSGESDGCEEDRRVVLILKIISKQLEDYSTEQSNQLLKAKLSLTIKKCSAQL